MVDGKRDSLGPVPAPTTQPALVPDEWFEEELLTGLRALCKESLYLRPQTPEEAGEIALQWARVLWAGRRWVEKRDRSRLQAAFGFLIGGHRLRGTDDASKFPTSADLIDALPALEYDNPPLPTGEEAEKNRETSRRVLRELHERMAPDQKKAAESKLEKMRTINAVLRHKGLPVFRNDTELRRHQIRQEAVGDLIANVKL